MRLCQGIHVIFLPSSCWGCWAAQVCSFLHFMSPIVDGKPQRIETSVVSAHLQRRMYDAVNGSDLRKVREWLEVRKEGRFTCMP